MNRIWKGICLGSAVLTLTTAAAAQVETGLLKGLVWRNIGPFRGGRVAAVSGAIGQPGTFYMGMPAGGVWKTTSAGATWTPIFDAVKSASSVGAVEVAPSDPNVIYVGMGDMRTGGSINEGDGVYKSTDAGKTWTHLGLDDTKQIPSILVDPHNPDIVMVAAQGDVRKESDTRGIFRSTDGGKTWTKTLFVDKQTGIQKITWAYDHPETMLATTVRHYQAPGASPRFGGGGGAPGAAQGPTGTDIYISHDEGITWKPVIGNGLPDTLAGRTCVAIANHTDAKRMYFVGNFGLYRSDDGGTNWRQMDADDRRVANGQGGYNCGVYVNPQNPDTVYVINTCSYRSLDGGKTFTGFKGAPGGDDPQQMWLDPTDGNRLFLGTDQGATVSLDGGQNWSSWYNQPTAQVYHISVDTQWPYWVYATQQDSGSIGTASRGNLGEITPMDWLPHPGYEFGSIVADPLNPKISYAGGPSGGIIKTTYPSGQWIDVSPNLEPGVNLRKASNQEIGYSPTNPHELFAAFQYLMSTTDGGLHWKKLSPDLGMPKPDPNAKPAVPAVAPKPKPDAAKPTAGTPIKPGGGTGQVKDNDADKNKRVDDDDDDGIDPDDYDAMVELQAQQPGGAIESFSVSSVDGKTIWTGTTNGLVKVTKDHGSTWEDADIPGIPNPRRADISCIDASHQDLGTAYVAIDYHNVGDYQPYVYRTHDYGHTWQKITTGLPTDLASGSFARVIKADTQRSGLLFLGTESSVYVSFDDGDHWQSLALNAPTTSYRDMVVKGDDLVVGTYGRSFWVLDDISPLRQLTAATMAEPAHIYRPGDAVRVRRNVNGDTPFPPEVPHAVNPPVGALIYYSLNEEPKGRVSIEISDSDGHVIRHISNDPILPANEPQPPVPNFWVSTPKPMPGEAGLNRINWDLRYDDAKAFNHSYEINANPGETPASPEAPLALPGQYTVTLKVGGKVVGSQPLTVINDPRSPATMDDLRAEFQLQYDAYTGARQAFYAFQDMGELHDQIAALQKAKPKDDISKALTDLDTKVTALRGSQVGRGRRFGGPAGPPPAPTASRLVGSMDTFMSALDSGDMVPNEAMVNTDKALMNDLNALMKSWDQVRKIEVPKVNALLEKSNMVALKM